MWGEHSLWEYDCHYLHIHFRQKSSDKHCKYKHPDIHEEILGLCHHYFRPQRPRHKKKEQKRYNPEDLEGSTAKDANSTDNSYAKNSERFQSLKLCLYILKTQNSTLRKAYDNGTSTERTFWGTRKDKWCDFEEIFYAYKTNPPDEANAYERTNFAYFTKIGVGGEGQIRKINFRLTFDPVGR